METLARSSYHVSVPAFILPRHFLKMCISQPFLSSFKVWELISHTFPPGHDALTPQHFRKIDRLDIGLHKNRKESAMNCIKTLGEPFYWIKLAQVCLSPKSALLPTLRFVAIWNVTNHTCSPRTAETRYKSIGSRNWSSRSRKSRIQCWRLLDTTEASTWMKNTSKFRRDLSSWSYIMSFARCRELRVKVRRAVSLIR